MIDLEKERSLIESTALKNGFKLKQQPNGKMALNPYVFDFAEELLANKQAEITELKQRLEKLERDEWISVKDRLPDQDQFVLCYDPKGGVYTNGYGSCYNKCKFLYDYFWLEEVADNFVINPTHWQPLPEPPKEEK